MTTSTLSQKGQITIPATTSTEALYGVFKSDRNAPTKDQIAEGHKVHYAKKLEQMET